MAVVEVVLTNSYQLVCTGASAILQVFGGDGSGASGPGAAVVQFAAALPADDTVGIKLTACDDQPVQYNATALGGKVYAKGQGRIRANYL